MEKSQNKKSYFSKTFVSLLLFNLLSLLIVFLAALILEGPALSFQFFFLGFFTFGTLFLLFEIYFSSFSLFGKSSLEKNEALLVKILELQAQHPLKKVAFYRYKKNRESFFFMESFFSSTLTFLIPESSSPSYEKVTLKQIEKVWIQYASLSFFERKLRVLCFYNWICVFIFVDFLHLVFKLFSKSIGLKLEPQITELLTWKLSKTFLAMNNFFFHFQFPNKMEGIYFISLDPWFYRPENEVSRGALKLLPQKVKTQGL